jgi:hypothetical protein
MEIHSPDIPTSVKPTPERVAELDRLGDAIAELSAHLEAATARLLDLTPSQDGHVVRDEVHRRKQRSSPGCRRT